MCPLTALFVFVQYCQCLCLDKIPGYRGSLLWAWTFQGEYKVDRKSHLCLITIPLTIHCTHCSLLIDLCVGSCLVAESYGFIYRKKFVSINTARPLEEGHVQRQTRWKKAKSENLLGMRRQESASVVTVL